MPEADTPESGLKADDDRVYFLAFDRPPPLTLFLAVIDGIERRFKGSTLFDEASDPRWLATKRGPVLGLRLGEEVDDDADDDDLDDPDDGAVPLPLEP